MKTSPLTFFHEMRLFIIVWVGQLVTFTGSSLTAFALDVWVYKRTGSVTQFALVTLFTTLPLVFVSPLAGSLVDRWDRRLTIMITDLCACLGTLAIGGLFIFHQLEVWHIYIVNLFSSIFIALQLPAYLASTTQLVPKQHFGRANGMINLLQSIARILAPSLGGVLLDIVHLPGIVLIDFVTMLFAIIFLMLIRFPEINTSGEQAEERSLLKDANYGLTYLSNRPGLLGLVLLSSSSIYLMGGVEVITTPLVLTFASTTILGTILSIFGFGLLLGSLVMTIGGGWQRNIRPIFSCTFLSGIFVLVSGLSPSLVFFTSSVFFFFVILPIISSSTQSIMLNKVEIGVQGRVFSIKGAVEIAALSLGYITIGPLAEKVFEPLMATNGLLAGSVGQIIGVGAGRGMGLLLIVMGAFLIIETCISYLYPRLRLVEDELPDVISDAVTGTASEAFSTNDVISSAS